MRSLAILIFELLLVVLGIFLADSLQSTVDFIPSVLIKLPDVDYTRGDFSTVLAYFLITHCIIFLMLRWLFGVWRPGDTLRTVEELFGLALAFSISALLLFVTSSVAFDPNFIVGIALITAVLFIGIHFLWAIVAGRPFLAVLGGFLSGVFRRAITIPGILILLAALSPALLAKLFVSDRDVANVITQIRIYFSQEGNERYSFVNAFGERKFSQPMLVKEDPVDPSRLFILERDGRLLALRYPQGDEEQVVLDIRERVGIVAVENGTLGFAFHPGFGQPGSVGSNDIFVYYTAFHNGEQINRLSRFTVGGSSPDQASASEQTLFGLHRVPGGFHNGGSIEFGSDGFLYVALGEGVHPKSTKLQSETLRSGILRLDVDCAGGEVSRPISRQPAEGQTLNYCIPADNPFLDEPDIMDEYWALGLRNPFRMSFDSKTGDLWAGDVGSTKWEEVNLLRAGANYQFPYVEGYEDTRHKKPDPMQGDEVGPLYTYIHTAYDRAVIGGVVYRGKRFSELRGQYLFADNYSSRIFSMPASGQKVDVVDHIATANQYAQRGTSSLTALSDGNVLITTLGRSTVPTGEVLEMVRGKDRGAVVDSEPAIEEVVSKEEVRELYVANCARCHGPGGDGIGPDSPLLGVPLPDFTSRNWQLSTTDEQLHQVIVEGGNAVGLSVMMPPWGHLLTETEVGELIRLVRDFGAGTDN